MNAENLTWRKWGPLPFPFAGVEPATLIQLAESKQLVV
jgi:hypothetical protein